MSLSCHGPLAIFTDPCGARLLGFHPLLPIMVTTALPLTANSCHLGSAVPESSLHSHKGTQFCISISCHQPWLAGCPEFLSNAYALFFSAFAILVKGLFSWPSGAHRQGVDVLVLNYNHHPTPPPPPSVASELSELCLSTKAVPAPLHFLYIIVSSNLQGTVQLTQDHL